MKQKITKRVAFNIERAKAIQSRKINGRIVTRYNDEVEIIYWDRKGSVMHIVALVSRANGRQDVITCNSYGELSTNGTTTDDLFIEITEETECEFQPFQQVLVREQSNDVWVCHLFSQFDIEGCFRTIGGGIYNHCIPYNEQTKHLVGTTDNWEE